MRTMSSNNVGHVCTTQLELTIETLLFYSRSLAEVNRRSGQN